jgi:uncharacterized repeat protein (TIGR01451 family)
MNRFAICLGLLVSLAIVAGGISPVAAQAPAEEVDLRVHKGADYPGAGLRIGDTLDFEVLVVRENSGDTVARDVDLTDILPANVEFVEGSFWWDGGPPDSLVYDAASRAVRARWAKAGATLIRYSVVVTRPGSITNHATVRSRGTTDPNPANDTDSAQVWGQFPDYHARVTKTPSTSEASIGSRIGFRVTWENTGPGTAYDVQLTDALPEGAEFVRGSLPPFCFPGATRRDIICYLGDRPPGSRVELSYTVAIAALPPDGVLRNLLATHTAAVFGDSGGSAEAEVRITLPVADVAVKKTVDKAPVAAGATVDYRITVRNNGPDTAYGTTISDSLPGVGEIVASSLPSTCEPVHRDLDPGSAVVAFACALGDIPAGEERTFTYQVLADEAGRLGNIAIVSTASSDSNDANDAQTTTDTVTDSGDSPACRKCIERHLASACGRACRPSQAACTACIRSVRTHECRAACSSQP